MMKRNWFPLMVAGLMLPVAVMFTATQLTAQTPPDESLIAQEGPPGAPDGAMAERWLKELDLSEAQITQIRTIHDGNKDETRALLSQLWTERDVMHELMSGATSEEELRTQHEKIKALHDELADQRFASMLAIRTVLTPAQRTELGELMEQHRENRRDGLRGLQRVQRRFQRFPFP